MRLARHRLQCSRTRRRRQSRGLQHLRRAFLQLLAAYPACSAGPFVEQHIGRHPCRSQPLRPAHLPQPLAQPHRGGARPHRPLNLSTNNFTGDVAGCFDECPRLEYLDLSSNGLAGEIWKGYAALREFSVSENYFTGEISPSTFPAGCALEILDLSSNRLSGMFPNSVANCPNLTVLNLWGNNFSGGVPTGIGSFSELKALNLGSHQFDPVIPTELTNCSKLVFLDFSKSNFTGDIQEIFGRFLPLQYLILEGNRYTGGINSSGILGLPNLLRLDLSSNRLSGDIPVELGQMAGLQLLDLSYNNLTGSIPAEIGKLTSLLWLMLANNSLAGEIPVEIGNCKSLLWLNLANNRISGSIPQEITSIGVDPLPVFETNRREIMGVAAGSGECLGMQRWIPVSYSPFGFIYTLMKMKTCRSTWDNLKKGYGIFPICANSSSRVRTFTSSGYLQLSGNQLSSGIPTGIGRMKNVGLIHLNENRLSGHLPAEIGQLPLVVLNVSDNQLSGAIPETIGNIRCLASLDLSMNNFSGELPACFNELYELNNFNVSYNPLLSGEVPMTGQISTFDQDSFLGDPLIGFASSPSKGALPPHARSTIISGGNDQGKTIARWVILALCSVFFGWGILCLAILSWKTPLRR